MSQTTNTSTANGKVIVCGEHSVVYGRDALAAALPCGVEARAVRADTSTLSIDGRRLKPDEPAVTALACIAQTLKTPPCAVDVTLRMPVGVGLGASAAMAVAVTRAVATLYERGCDQETLLRAAHLWESEFHGTPSGVDAACAALGGCLLYNRHRGPVATTVGRPLYLAIAVAGPASSTKAMVARVAAIRERDHRQFELALDHLQTIVQSAQRAVASGAHAELGALVDENHRLLVNWQLSTPAIEQACSVARTAGAYGAKLTGAGGGGCVLAVGDAHTQPLIARAWEQLELQTLSVCIDATSSNDPPQG